MEHTQMKPKNTICLWFDEDAHEGARFYAATFPDSEVIAVHDAPGDYLGGKKGDVLTVEFTVLGIPCLGLNGGPQFRHSEAFSFQIATDNQEETDGAAENGDARKWALREGLAGAFQTMS
jgi:predicted 3-demethylubiquinone-9 3-methyltransferase (glyoxalase superfamily)